MKASGVADIGRRDVAWGYLATFFQMGAGVILLPFVLNKMQPETVGLWTVFQTISSLVLMFDFGFTPSFSRNISYIFSGVSKLQTNGVAVVSERAEVDYSLLKNTIAAMQRFYSLMAVGVLAILLVGGTLYMHYLLVSYSGNMTDAWWAWGLLVAISTYNIYTLYYDSLLQGKGYIRRLRQITIVGQSVYLLVTIGLIMLGFGLSAIVAAQLLSTLIRRLLAYQTFYTPDMRQKLAVVKADNSREIMQAIYPNACKMGLTNLGGFCVTKSAVFLGSAYLTLSEIAEYGITTQVIGIIAALATVYYQTYIPKLAQGRAERNVTMLWQKYKMSVAVLVLVFVLMGTAFVLLGDWALQLIGSNTNFLPLSMTLVALLVALLEQNHIVAANFLAADNRIPFFKASLISGAATIVLLWLMLSPLHMGIWGMILASGFVQIAYQNWKWPLMIVRELKGKQ